MAPRSASKSRVARSSSVLSRAISAAALSTVAKAAAFSCFREPAFISFQSSIALRRPPERRRSPPARAAFRLVAGRSGSVELGLASGNVGIQIGLLEFSHDVPFMDLLALIEVAADDPARDLEADFHHGGLDVPVDCGGGYLIFRVH